MENTGGQKEKSRWVIFYLINSLTTEKQNDISETSSMNQDFLKVRLADVIYALVFLWVKVPIRTLYDIGAYMASARRSVKASWFIKDVLETIGTK